MFAEFSKKSEKYKQRINFPISINSELVQKFNSLCQNSEHLISAFSEYASGFEGEKEFHQKLKILRSSLKSLSLKFR